MLFIQQQFVRYAQKFNLLVLAVLTSVMMLSTLQQLIHKHEPNLGKIDIVLLQKIGL